MFRTWSLSWYGRCRLSRWRSSVDVVDQAELPGQEVDGADAAGGDGPGPIGDLVVDVGGGHHRLVALRRRADSRCGGDSPLACGSWRWTLAFTRKPPGGEWSRG